MSIFDYFKGDELTEGQHDFLLELDQALIDGVTNIFLLKGFAGTGKTHMFKGIVKYLNAEMSGCVIMTPTGKAARVIADKTGSEANTIHRVIYDYYNKRKKDVSGAVSQIELRTNTKLKENKDSIEMVYILDEASMISNQYSKSDDCTFGCLLDDLLSYADLHNFKKRKMIIIGDNAQLPPVKDNYSPALDAEYLKTHYNLSCQSIELTEVVRQKKDSGVLKNANYLRKIKYQGEFKGYKFDADYHDISLVEHKEFIERYYEICDGDVKNTDEAIVICSTNLKVHQYNSAFRAMFFKFDALLQEGEKIICIKNHSLPEEDGYIFNGEFGRVLNISPEIERRGVYIDKFINGKLRSEFVELSFIDVTLRFTRPNGISFTIHKKVLWNLLFEQAPKLTGSLQKAIRKDFFNRNPDLDLHKRSEEYYERASKDPYLNIIHIKFGYAITCHKAQGGEWPHVFVDTFMPAPLFRHYFRWLYTAITRTSNQLYIYDWFEPTYS